MPMRSGCMVRVLVTVLCGPQRLGPNGKTGPSLSEEHFAVLDHSEISLLHFGLERDHVAVAPQLHADRLTRIHRSRKARLVGANAGRLKFSEGFQHGTTSDSRRAQTMQDRPRETSGVRGFRIGVQ